MDESKYRDLREKVRDVANTNAKNQAFIARFIHAVEAYVNKSVDLDTAICFAGTQEGATFERGSFQAQGSTMRFAFQVLFHDHNGKELLSSVVEFVAKCHPNSLLVQCTDTAATIEIGLNQVDQDDAKAAVARLLETSLERKLSETLHKIESGSFA